MGIIDLHCDTLLNCFLGGENLRDAGGHLNLEKLKQGGATAQCFAIFLPTGEAAKRYGIPERPYEMFQEIYVYYQSQLRQCGDIIRPAYTAADVKENSRRGILSSILTVEDCALLDGKLERVDELSAKGVRMAGLTWNYENCVGYPRSEEPDKHGLGLNAFGLEALERMNDKGIIADVSHLSEGGFFDVARHSKKPFAASHSCARALCSHSRNLSDDQLHVIGETGSVVGVNFHSFFLADDCDYTAISQIAEHAVYMANKAGIEAVALGSDFDGIDNALEMEDYAGYPRVIGELQKHFSDSDVERIAQGNFLRVFEECAVPLLREDEEYKNPVLERVD